MMKEECARPSLFEHSEFVSLSSSVLCHFATFSGIE
jgi:hypothetical protein